MPEQSLNRGGNNWISHLLHQSDERRTSAGVKKCGPSSLITNKEKERSISCRRDADYQTQASAFRSLFNEKMKQ